MVALDPRINPFRPELAAKHLQGQVEAARFVEGTHRQVVEPARALRRAPSHEAALDTRGAAGRARHDLRDDRRGLGLGPARNRRLCRLAAGQCARTRGPAPTHKVAVLRTLAFPGGRTSSCRPSTALPMGARLAIARQDERFAVTASGWHVPEAHLAPIKARQPDFVAVAERFLGTPYLWGGKTSLGLDCSGLVQVALQAAGIACPRDSDMQELALGKLSSLAESAPRRPGVLERPRRHRARSRDPDPRQCASYDGRDRAIG